jgi:hypothetical protein
MLRGSVSAKVVKDAPAPVMLVSWSKVGPARADWPVSLLRFSFWYDGGDSGPEIDDRVWLHLVLPP